MYPDSADKNDSAGYALTHYAGNVRVLGGDLPWTLKRIENGDGLSNTLLAGEAAGNYKPWGHPMNWRDPALGLNKTPNGFGNPFRRGTVMLFADGHVQTLHDGISPDVLKALSTPNGGEDVRPEDY